MQAQAPPPGATSCAERCHPVPRLPPLCSPDVDATIEMLLALKKAAPQLRLTFGCSTFVAKAHTPFQVGARVGGQRWVLGLGFISCRMQAACMQ